MRAETDNDFRYIDENQSWLGSGLGEVFDSDNRKKLRPEKYHMLCYWKLFDNNHLLSHTMCKLRYDVRVDSNFFPVTIGTPESASKEDEKCGKRI